MSHKNKRKDVRDRKWLLHSIPRVWNPWFLHFSVPKRALPASPGVSQSATTPSSSGCNFPNHFLFHILGGNKHQWLLTIFFPGKLQAFLFLNRSREWRCRGFSSRQEHTFLLWALELLLDSNFSSGSQGIVSFLGICHVYLHSLWRSCPKRLFFFMAEFGYQVSLTQYPSHS